MTVVVTIWDIMCLIVLGIIILSIIIGIIINIVNKIKSYKFSKKHKEINKYDK